MILFIVELVEEDERIQEEDENEDAMCFRINRVSTDRRRTVPGGHLWRSSLERLPSTVARLERPGAFR